MHDVLPEDYIDLVYDENDPGPFQVNCAFCNGTGVDPATMNSMEYSKCPACDGQGLIQIEAARKDFCQCENCKGEGKEPNMEKLQPCSVCGGLGIHACN